MNPDFSKTIETAFPWLTTGGQVDVTKYGLAILLFIALMLVFQKFAAAYLWGANGQQQRIVMLISAGSVLMALTPFTVLLFPLGLVAAHFIAYRKGSPD